MQIGKYIMLFGVLIFIVGLIWYFWGDKLSWIGRLPGDIRIEKGNTKIFFPITTMILLSVLISVIQLIIRKLMN